MVPAAVADLTRIRQRHISLMEQTLQTLGHVLRSVPQTTATTVRDAHDGPKGWTVLEVLCHLRDYDGIFRQRAELMVAEDYPHLPGYDHEALARERDYNRQDLRQVWAGLTQSRQATIQLFRGLTDAQWERAGIHPERGHFTLTDAVVQVGTHDCIHLEQITRILFDNQA